MNDLAFIGLTLIIVGVFGGLLTLVAWFFGPVDSGDPYDF